MEVIDLTLSDDDEERRELSRSCLNKLPYLLHRQRRLPKAQDGLRKPTQSLRRLLAHSVDPHLPCSA
jgi:hypothetical protein